MKTRMNKELFDVIEQTRNNLNGKVDRESQRYLDKTILERRLDGKPDETFKMKIRT
jgi:hypothetical protein